ncbi:MAG TPA: hypothetical protein PLF11_05620 [Bacillota bacterium]|nr:hypothetical protein [Bacillota bacterium]
MVGGLTILRRIPAWSVATTILGCLSVAGCHDPVEYDVSAHSGVVKIRVSDNTIVGSLGGIEDGRSLCSLGNTQFLVASGSGLLYRFDSEQMLLDTSYAIGYGSGSGYGDMVMPKPGSVYVIGSAGKILEVSLSSNSVVDRFDAGPLPGALCASSTNRRFYVADGSDRRIREVDPVGNVVLRQSQPLDEIPVAITTESFLDEYLLACCSDGAGSVGRVTLSTMATGPISLGSPCSAITSFPAESTWAVTHPEWFAENGAVSICRSFLLVPDVTAVQVAGHPTDICSVPGTVFFYVLSYLGDGTSRVTAIDYVNATIVGEVDIPGFPWDITSHANGEYVLALTSDM